jgi:hypothetical protein
MFLFNITVQSLKSLHRPFSIYHRHGHIQETKKRVCAILWSSCVSISSLVYPFLEGSLSKLLDIYATGPKHGYRNFDNVNQILPETGQTAYKIPVAVVEGDRFRCNEFLKCPSPREPPSSLHL